MTSEKVIEALREARAALADYDVKPVRLSEEEMSRPFEVLERPAALNHVAFLCDEAERMLTQEPHRREKVMRWLGFIQGALWVMSIRTISDSKNANRPDEPDPRSGLAVQAMVGGPSRIEFHTPTYGSRLPHGHGDDGHGGDDMHRGVETNRSGSNFMDGYDEGTFDK